MDIDDFTKSYRRELGYIIRKRRLELNLSQRAIARHVGVSIPTVSCWENGTRPLPVEKLPLIAQVLDVHTHHLLPDYKFNPNKDMP